MKFGSLIKGFSSTFNISNIMNIQQLKWQKKEMEQLEKDKEAYKEAIGMFQTNNKDLFDGLSTQGGTSGAGLNLITNAYAISDDFGRAVKEYTLAINSNNRQAAEQAHEKMQLITEYMLKLQLGGGELAESWSVEDFVSEESKKWIRARDVYKATPTATMPYEMTKEMAGMAGFKDMPKEMPTKPPTKPPTLSAKDNWAIENYKTGKINFDELSKYMGTYIAPEEMSAKEKEVELIKEYGGTNEEIKNKLLGKGVEGEPTPPTAPAIENVREDIKNADTVEDARRIHQNQIKKYGEEGLGVDDVDKFWAESQIPYLDNIKATIGNIIDEKGRLKKGTLTSAEVGVDFKGEQSVEEIYKMLREEYMKYRSMLEKLGMDISQFPELLTFEEYEKADIKPGMGLFYPSTWGKQKPSIYK